MLLGQPGFVGPGGSVSEQAPVEIGTIESEGRIRLRSLEAGKVKV